MFWEQETLTYLDANGIPVEWGNDGQPHKDDGTIAAIVTGIISFTVIALRFLAGKLSSGAIGLDVFTVEAADLLRQLHVTIGTLSMGGMNNVSMNDLNEIKKILDTQFGYFQGLVDDISSGKQKINKKLMQRLDMYANSGWGTFIGLLGYMAATYGGKTEERRILGIADHCPDCVEWAGLGWKPIGTLPPIGASVCKTNCHCVFDYR